MSEKHLNLICIWTRFHLHYVARGILPVACGTITESSTLSYFRGNINLCPTTNLLPLVLLKTLMTRGLHEIMSPSSPFALPFSYASFLSVRQKDFSPKPDTNVILLTGSCCLWHPLKYMNFCLSHKWISFSSVLAVFQSFMNITGYTGLCPRKVHTCSSGELENTS